MNIRSGLLKGILITGLVIILVASGVVFFYRAYVSADEVGGDFIDTFEEKRDLSAKTLIKLPAGYSADQIKSEIASSSKSSNSEVVSYIKSEAAKKAKNAPPVTIKAEPGKLQNLDLVFYVVDSNGNLIKKSENSNSVNKGVESNFQFDTQAPAEMKANFIKAYPEIEKVYGLRPLDGPIKVVYEKGLSRAYYTHGLNEIHIGDDGIETVVHETTHAFHNFYELPSVWEEGMAEKATELVVKKLLPDYNSSAKQIIIDGYRDARNVNSLDVNVSAIINSPWDYMLPYSYGSQMMDQIYYADSNFFINFNSHLKQYPGYITQPQIIRLAVKSTSAIVEGKKLAHWFLDQAALYNFYDQYQPSQKELFYAEVSGLNRMDGYYEKNDIYLNIHSSYKLGSTDFTTKFTYPDGTLIADESNCRDNWKDDYVVYKYCKSVSAIYAEYEGVIQVEITPTHHPDEKRIQKFYKPKGQTPKSGAVVISENTGGLAKITNLRTGQSLISKISNGFYYYPGKNFINEAGDFRVEEFKFKNSTCHDTTEACLGKKLYVKRFHKPETLNSLGSSGTVIYTKKPNTCSTKIEDFEVTNHSVIASYQSDACGSVVAINNIPMYRNFGDVKYDLPGLKRGTSYGLQLLVSSGTGAGKVIKRKFQTSDFPDLNILNVQQNGTVLDNTLATTIEFNVPVKPESINLSYCEAVKDVECVATTKEMLSDKIVRIKPIRKLFNNTIYDINGVKDILDQNNYRPYRIHYEKFILSTPINPAGAAQPELTVVSQFSEYGDVVISKNFESNELRGKLTEIELMGYNSEKDLYESIPSSAKLVGGKLVISHSQGLKSDFQYYVILPPITDNQNNRVNQEWISINSNTK